MDLFEHLRNLTATKTPLDTSDRKAMSSYVPFMISRYVSMNELYLPFVNELNKVGNMLPKEMHYAFMLATLPQRQQYFQYLTRKVSNQNADVEAVVMWFFQVGKREARERLRLLKAEQVEAMSELYEEANRTGATT